MGPAVGPCLISLALCGWSCSVGPALFHGHRGCYESPSSASAPEVGGRELQSRERDPLLTAKLPEHCFTMAGLNALREGVG